MTLATTATAVKGDRVIRGFACDIDETVSNTVLTWMGLLSQHFGNPHNWAPEQLVKEYKFTDRVPFWGSDAKEWLRAQHFNRPLHLTFQPMEGSVQAIRELHTIIPITLWATIRPVEVSEETKAWLLQHGFPEAELLARPQDITLEDANRWKARRVAELYPHIIGIIDNSPSVMEHLPSDYPGVGLLFDCDTSPRTDINVIPCPTWADVLRHTHQYARTIEITP